MKEEAKTNGVTNKTIVQDSPKTPTGEKISATKRKKSSITALKSVFTHVETLNDDYLLTKEEMVAIYEILSKAKERFINETFKTL